MWFNNTKSKIRRIPTKLVLGATYSVYWGNSRKGIMMCKLIQPTEKGFNLLNLFTNKCILKQHLYVSKYPRHSEGTWFWVNSNLIITRVS